MSIFVKSCLMSVFQAFGYGGGLRDRGLIWTEPRSLLPGLLVRPIFCRSGGKWLLGIKIIKMVTIGRSSMHLQKASQLSRQWGPCHMPKLPR